MLWITRKASRRFLIFLIHVLIINKNPSNLILTLTAQNVRPLVVIAGDLLYYEPFQILKSIAVPVDLSDKTDLVKAAVTSLNSKVKCTLEPSLVRYDVDAFHRPTFIT